MTVSYTHLDVYKRQDRRKLLNGNSFRLGVSGSGKSFSAKEEIVDLALSTEDDILILDPESEFASLVEALNGEVIRISEMCIRDRERIEAMRRRYPPGTEVTLNSMEGESHMPPGLKGKVDMVDLSLIHI